MGFNHDYGGVYEQPTASNVKKTRVYISGPMTGLPGLNFAAFNAEAVRLKALGYEVINPVDFYKPCATWKDLMRLDLAALLTCDKVVLLDGFERSEGAHLEMNVAHRVGIEIVLAKDIQAAEVFSKEEIACQTK